MKLIACSICLYLIQEQKGVVGVYLKSISPGLAQKRQSMSK